MKKYVLVFILLFITVSVFAKMPKNYIPVNPDMKRVILIENNDPNGEMKVKNICWGRDTVNKVNVYKNTTIKFGNVKEVYYVSQKFAPEWIAAHGMIAIIMKDDSSILCEDGRKARGLMLSVEAWRDKGVDYDIKTGLFKNFKLIFMMYTFEGRLQISSGISKNKLELARIDINDTQKQQLFNNIVKECLIDKTKIYYHSLTESCVTNAAKLINTVLEKKRRLRLWTIPKILPNIRVSMPVFITRYFCKKKIGIRMENIVPEDYKKYLSPDYWPTVMTSTESVSENLPVLLDTKLSNIKRLTGSKVIEKKQNGKVIESKSLTPEKLDELKALQDIELIDKLIEMNSD
ncbi:DUF4105 domain-containing protein [bacterium]|nr:DUF4105 domain-containing protein [bacterium]